MINKINKKDLSDFDIESLPDGFAIIFENEKPVGAIVKYKYFQYISQLINKVKKYVESFPKQK